MIKPQVYLFTDVIKYFGTYQELASTEPPHEFCGHCEDRVITSVPCIQSLRYKYEIYALIYGVAGSCDSDKLVSNQNRDVSLEPIFLIFSFR